MQQRNQAGGDKRKSLGLVGTAGISPYLYRNILTTDFQHVTRHLHRAAPCMPERERFAREAGAVCGGGRKCSGRWGRGRGRRIPSSASLPVSAPLLHWIFRILVRVHFSSKLLR